MSLLAKTFERGPAYIGYLTAGDGGMAASLGAFRALITAGVDILEVGVPFSDPCADGPVITEAMQRALEQGIRLLDVLELVSELKREAETVPIILFSYYNPLLQAGPEIFAKARAAGVDALLVVDLPLEHGESLASQCRDVGIELIYLVTPATTEARILQICKQASGAIYYVCHKGTTGVRSQAAAGLDQQLALLRQHSQVPVMAGFGIASKERAAATLEQADGFVVGSYLVQALADGVSGDALVEHAKAIDPR